MPPPSPKAKMLESLRIPDGEGMPSPYNTTIRYVAKQSFTAITDTNTPGEIPGVHCIQLPSIWRNSSIYRLAGLLQLKSCSISRCCRARKPARSLLYRFSARFRAA